MQNEQIWRAFYEAAIAFRDLKPWEWMYDGDLFGVEDPETGQTNYCCVMGNAGEVFALGYYLGEEGLKSYFTLANQPDGLTPVDQMSLGLNQLLLKVEFVNREELDKPDLDTIKALGLKFRGKNQWVQAREMKPAHLPMPIDDEQARILTIGLQQAVEVAMLFKEDESILGNEDTRETLIRKKDKGTWVNTYALPKLFNVDPFPVVSPDPERIKRARQYPQKETAWLFIHEYLTTPVGHESGKGYYFPKINLWVNYADGFINNFQLIEPGEEEKVIGESFFENLKQVKFRPQQIGVNSLMAFRAIKEFCEPLDIELLFIPDEPLFDEIMQSFQR
jgi:hypothetical protein